MVTGISFRGQPSQGCIIAALCLGYLALVAEFGYQIALLPSGLLMREQFFNPHNFRPAIPITSQILLGHAVSLIEPNLPMWAKPFSFSFREGACAVGARNFGIIVPVSRDPRQPIAQHLPIAPDKYKLRPSFTTVFS
jgi:hypothetical protein